MSKDIEFKKINELLDEFGRTLVGILLKRIDVLEEQDTLSPKLYKSLIKENIYEQIRTLKKLISVYLEIGILIFKSRKI